VGEQNEKDRSSAQFDEMSAGGLFPLSPVSSLIPLTSACAQMGTAQVWPVGREKRLASDVRTVTLLWLFITKFSI
jgi:hypothetical protein